MVPDPVKPQTLNRYGFASGNPLRYVDANGHCGPFTPVCLALLLGGMALLLQGDSPDLNVTPEDVASQRLGGALFVSGAGLTGATTLSALAAGAGNAGTTATTAACADGDCTNEVRAVDSAARTATDASQVTRDPAALRQAYETAVKGLAEKANQLREAGKSVEQIARQLHAERRQLGIQYKEMTPPDMLEKIYERNLQRYGDRLGPTIDYLRAQGKSWEDIIESASRPGGQDIVPKLLGRQ